MLSQGLFHANISASITLQPLDSHINSQRNILRATSFINALTNNALVGT